MFRAPGAVDDTDDDRDDSSSSSAAGMSRILPPESCASSPSTACFNSSSPLHASARKATLSSGLRSYAAWFNSSILHHRSGNLTANQVRLRDRPVRRMHSTRGRARDSMLHHRGRRSRRRPGDHHRGARPGRQISRARASFVCFHLPVKYPMILPILIPSPTKEPTSCR